MKIVLGTAGILTAFDEFGTVGTKVIDGIGEFQHLLKQEMRRLIAIEVTELNEKRAAEKLEELEQSKAESRVFQGGQFIEMPTDAYHLVRNGVALKEGLEEKDVFHRRYRGKDRLFANPEFAVKKVESLGVFVMARNAYFADPEVSDEERANQLDAESTHVMVAIHAPTDQPLDYVRLASNISGLNNDFVLKTLMDGEELIHTASELLHDSFVAHKMRKAAQETLEYEKKWIVVAEPRPLTHAEKNRN